MRALIGAPLLIIALACGGDATTPTPHSTNKTVDIVTSGETFLPTIETIAVRDTVRWTFAVAADGLGHNVLFKPRIAGAPDDITKEVRSGSVTRVFGTAGEFNYVCDLHGGMTAKIIVQ